MDIKKIFRKSKKIFEPETCTIHVTDDRWSSKGSSLIKLIELYFPKYKLEYSILGYDAFKNLHKSIYHYDIVIPYKNKIFVETLLTRVFQYDEKHPSMLISEYERWLKIERIKQKILDI